MGIKKGLLFMYKYLVCWVDKQGYSHNGMFFADTKKELREHLKYLIKGRITSIDKWDKE